VRLVFGGRAIKDESRTLSDYRIGANDKIQMLVRMQGSIGIFDSQHLGSEGRAWLMKTKNDATKEEVTAMIERLGGSQNA
jgi:hypothetical protein